MKQIVLYKAPDLPSEYVAAICDYANNHDQNDGLPVHTNSHDLNETLFTIDERYWSGRGKTPLMAIGDLCAQYQTELGLYITDDYGRLYSNKLARTSKRRIKLATETHIQLTHMLLLGREKTDYTARLGNSDHCETATNRHAALARLVLTHQKVFNLCFCDGQGQHVSIDTITAK